MAATARLNAGASRSPAYDTEWPIDLCVWAVRAKRALSVTPGFNPGKAVADDREPFQRFRGSSMGEPARTKTQRRGEG